MATSNANPAPNVQERGQGPLGLFAFVAFELQDCFGHIGNALHAYNAGEELPEPRHSGAVATAQGSGKRGKRQKNPDKPKRQPTAYNVFVKRAMESLKASGFDYDPATRGKFQCPEGLSR